MENKDGDSYMELENYVPGGGAKIQADKAKKYYMSLIGQGYSHEEARDLVNTGKLRPYTRAIENWRRELDKANGIERRGGARVGSGPARGSKYSKCTANVQNAPQEKSSKCTANVQNAPQEKSSKCTANVQNARLYINNILYNKEKIDIDNNQTIDGDRGVHFEQNEKEIKVPLKKNQSLAEKIDSITLDLSRGECNYSVIEEVAESLAKQESSVPLEIIKEFITLGKMYIPSFRKWAASEERLVETILAMGEGNYNPLRLKEYQAKLEKSRKELKDCCFKAKTLVSRYPSLIQ